MTKEMDSTRNQSTWLIIAALVISVSSLLCCGCLAVAWLVGDVAVQIFEQISTSIHLLPT